MQASSSGREALAPLQPVSTYSPGNLPAAPGAKRAQLVQLQFAILVRGGNARVNNTAHPFEGRIGLGPVLFQITGARLGAVGMGQRFFHFTRGSLQSRSGSGPC